MEICPMTILHGRESSHTVHLSIVIGAVNILIHSINKLNFYDYWCGCGGRRTTTFPQPGLPAVTPYASVIRLLLMIGWWSYRMFQTSECSDWSMFLVDLIPSILIGDWRTCGEGLNSWGTSDSADPTAAAAFGAHSPARDRPCVAMPLTKGRPETL